MLILLTKCDRVKFRMLNQVFKIKINKGPVYLCDNFNAVSNVLQSRACKYDFFVPRVQGIASKTFYFIGIKDWNNLPDQIKSIRNILKFKSRTKEFLAKRAIAMENCEFKTFQVG